MPPFNKKTTRSTTATSYAPKSPKKAAPPVQYTLGGSKRNQVFSVHLYKVLKQCHPENVGISKKGMHVLNSLMFDIFEQIALEASNVLRMSKKRTMTSRTV